MAVKQVKFQDPKLVEVKWSSWAKGLNTLVAPSKIRDDELSVATNILLEDEGSPAKRWGTADFGNNTGISKVWDIYPYYKSDGTNQLLINDGGFIKRYDRSTGIGTLITGASFTSGVHTRGVLAFDTLYLSNGVDNLTKYDGSSLTQFVALSAPASNWATRGGSQASGQYSYSYRVTAVRTGETTAPSLSLMYTNKPRNLWNPDVTSLNDGNAATVRWTPVTGATGYNIYGTTGGDERYLDHVDGEQVTQWLDYGYKQPSDVFVLPTGNSTQGVKGKYIIEFKSSLIIAGDPSQPSRVSYSGGIDKIDSFLISDGGGYIDISKNSDDGVITGLANFQNKAEIFKERSIWELNFTEAAIPSLINIRKGLGAVSHDTIRLVENDLFFMGRKVGGGAANYVLGNEPSFLNVLRTNELSNRVRPEFKAINASRLSETVGIYTDGKYMNFYPEGGQTYNSTGIVYDRERLGHTKFTNVNPRAFAVYYDSDKVEYVLYADGRTGKVMELSENYSSDSGAAIPWNIKTKETDIKDPFLYKKFKKILTRFRNIRGLINIRIWSDDTTIAYATSISGDSGGGSFRKLHFRNAHFRVSGGVDAGSAGVNNTVVRRIQIGRQGTAAIARSMALEIYGEQVDSKAVLLDVQMIAQPKSKNYYPRSEDIT